MKSTLFKLATRVALRTGRLTGLWKRLGHVDGQMWAHYLTRHGGLYAMGRDCSVQTNVTFTDPAYVSIGSNVHLSGCTIFGHDGVVNMLNRLGPELIDKVGPVVIGDDVFVGHQAIIMPGVRIGERSVVAAGAVVVDNVPAGAVVGGVPARVIGSTDAMRDRLIAQTLSLPWYHLLLSRHDPLAPADERLNTIRCHAFFGHCATGAVV